MKNNRFLRPLFFLLLWLALVAPNVSKGQLVADGQTNTLDGVTTNLSGGVTIGTNGAFTLLIIINGATVTNTSGNSAICANTAARTNTMMVTGAGSMFNNGPGQFFVGQSGSAAELDILNGGVVVNGNGAIGATGFSSNNFVLVSGAGSLWTNSGGLNIGSGNSYNLLIITNGGTVDSGGSSIGSSGSGISNRAVVTGAGSSWTSGYLYVGNMSGGGSQLVVTNGGTVFLTAGTCDIGVYNGSNVVMVTDPGSSLTCPTYRIGYSSTGNQCIVSNGATLSVTLNSSEYTMVEGTQTVATVTGTNSLWTNNCNFYVGQASNVLSILNGGMLADNTGYIVGGTGKPNTVIVSGTGSVWTNSGDFHAADAGSQLYITNGGKLIDRFGYFGDNAANSNCFAKVAGPGSVWSNLFATLYIGYNGPNNQLLVTDSGAVSATSIWVGENANNNSLVLSNSGSLSAANLYVGNQGNFTNSMTVAGGNVIVTDALNLYSYATFTMNSGYMYVKAINATIPNSRMVFSGGTIVCGGTAFFLSGGNPPPFTVGDGTNAATLILSNGTYIVGGISVLSNSTLTGTGTVKSNVFIGAGATFAPGNTNTYVLTITNSLVLSNGSTTAMNLNPQFSTNSNVQVTNVTYGGTLQLTNLGGSYFAGQTFKLFSAKNYSGAFTNLIAASPGPFLRWDMDELVVDGVLRVLNTNRPPVKLHFATQPGNLVITSSNGIAYDTCLLYTTTNLLAPSGGWTCIATNAYDVNGLVGFTNLIQAGEPQRYFKMAVN